MNGRMTRVIAVIGGKGGIGKTTLVSNLSSALASMGHNVVAVDANVTTPNLGLHLGLHLSPKTLHDVLKGNTSLKSATYSHPSGFKVVPASMSVSDLRDVDVAKLPEAISTLNGTADFVILDSAAGLGREAISSMMSANEILLITNPDMPSVADALKTSKIAEESGKKIIGVVLNRVKGKSHELSTNQVERLLGYKVVSEIPEDKWIPKSIAMKMPLHSYNPNSDASIEFSRLAHNLTGREFYGKRRSAGMIEALVRWMSK